MKITETSSLSLAHARDKLAHDCDLEARKIRIKSNHVSLDEAEALRAEATGLEQFAEEFRADAANLRLAERNAK